MLLNRLWPLPFLKAPPRDSHLQRSWNWEHHDAKPWPLEQWTYRFGVRHRWVGAYHYQRLTDAGLHFTSVTQKLNFNCLPKLRWSSSWHWTEWQVILLMSFACCFCFVLFSTREITLSHHRVCTGEGKEVKVSENRGVRSPKRIRSP